MDGAFLEVTFWLSQFMVSFFNWLLSLGFFGFFIVCVPFVRKAGAIFKKIISSK